MKTLALLFFSFFIFNCEAQLKTNDAIPLQEEAVNYRFETVADGINNPWGMAFLPDGSLLVTEKSGILYHVKNGVKTEVKNVPAVYNRGQGGLMDIELHPDYAKNGWIYMSYSSMEGEGEAGGANTAIIRAKLENESLVNIEKIYKATLIPKDRIILVPELLLTTTVFFSSLLGAVVMKMKIRRTLLVTRVKFTALTTTAVFQETILL